MFISLQKHKVLEKFKEVHQVEKHLGARVWGYFKLFCKALEKIKNNQEQLLPKHIQK